MLSLLAFEKRLAILEEALLTSFGAPATIADEVYPPY